MHIFIEGRQKFVLRVLRNIQYHHPYLNTVVIATRALRGGYIFPFPNRIYWATIAQKCYGGVTKGFYRIGVAHNMMRPMAPYQPAITCNLHQVLTHTEKGT